MTVPTSDATEAESLKSRVETWLGNEMSIIQNHGGTSAVREITDDGEVIIELGGTCSGCDIGGITAQNIERELTVEFDAVESVSVRFADVGGEQWGIDQRESVMGIDLTEGGRGDWGDSGENENHF